MFNPINPPTYLAIFYLIGALVLLAMVLLALPTLLHEKIEEAARKLNEDNPQLSEA